MTSHPLFPKEFPERSIWANWGRGKRARRKRARRRAHSEARGAVGVDGESGSQRPRLPPVHVELRAVDDVAVVPAWPCPLTCRATAAGARSPWRRCVDAAHGRSALRPQSARSPLLKHTRCGRATSLTEPAGALVVMALVWWPPQSCARRAAARRHAERHSRVLGHGGWAPGWWGQQTGGRCGEV